MQIRELPEQRRPADWSISLYYTEDSPACGVESEHWTIDFGSQKTYHIALRLQPLNIFKLSIELITCLWELLAHSPTPDSGVCVFCLVIILNFV